MLRPLLFLALSAAVPTASRADDEAVFAPLQALDARVATIGYRLAVANAPLCTIRMHATGLVIHDLAQYEPSRREAARRYFGFEAPIGVEAVVEGSPAAAAGVRPRDSLVAIDGQPIDLPFVTSSVAATTARSLRIDAALNRAGADGALRLDLLRGGKPLTVELRPVEACRSRFEVSFDEVYDSAADGETVQVSVKLMQAFRNDDEAAFILGHELAHNMLRHRVRLDEAGVKRGMFEGFGRSVGYIRRSELEADIVGLAFAANAGFDPAAAPRFWRWFGPKHAASIFMDRTHPRWSTRAAVLDGEAATLAQGKSRPFDPPLLATARQPLSNDWQALLAGSTRPAAATADRAAR